MSQVVHDKYAQMVKVSDTEMIPAAIISAQTRDGEDELVMGSANMQKDPVTGLYLPTDKDFPLEARVRELEKLIGEITENPTTHTVQHRLKQIEAELKAIKDIDFAKDKSVEDVVAKLEDVLGRLDQTLDVAGEVDVSSDPERELGKVQLTVGTLLELGLGRADTISPGGETVVFDTDDPIAIIWLQWGTNLADDVKISLTDVGNGVKDGEGDAFYLPTVDLSYSGGGRSFSYPSAIKERVGMWDIIRYDLEGDHYVFRIAAPYLPLILPEGGKLVIANKSTTETANWVVRGLGRRLA